VRQRYKNSGFTLLEVLVALAVFSVMSIMAYGGLKTVLNARNGTERAAERLTELQMAFILIQQDMQHMAPRSIRSEFYGMKEDALEVDSGLEYPIAFTRGGNSNPYRPHRSGFYRVGYQLEEEELRRLVWPTLDRAVGNVPQAKVLLHGVSEVTFSFLDENDNWINTWPPPGAQNMSKDLLPKAIEMVIVLDDWGTITRLFSMPH